MDTLEGMRVFAEVVETGSFSEAARRRGISKALASKYVRELEAKLAVQLLHRTTRQVTPTATGRACFERCAQILEDVRELFDAVQSEHGTLQGRLRVAGPRILGESLLVDAVTKFLVENPAIEIDLALEERTVDIVGEGFDLAIRIGELADSSLLARKLMAYRYVVCAAPAYLAKYGHPERPEDLKGHAGIVNTAISPTGQCQFQRADKRITISVPPRIRVNSGRAVRDFVVAGLGVGLCLLPTVTDDLEVGRLVRLFPENEAYDRNVYAVYPPSRHLSPKVRRFIDHLVSFLGGD
ncbi:MAG: LysR family transcriptional regulator [Pseudomonadota bacterium]